MISVIEKIKGCLPPKKPLRPSGRKIVAARLLVWLTVSVACALVYRAALVPALIAAAYTALYLLASFGDDDRRIVGAIDIAVDIVCASLVVASTGGLRGPFVLLYLPIMGEGQLYFGMPGALFASLAPLALAAVRLRAGTPFDSLLAYTVAVALMAAATVLDRVAALRVKEAPPTVLPARRIEDVDQQVEELQGQNRALRATCQELTVAAREQKQRLEELGLCQRLISVSAQQDEADRLFERILRLLMEAFGAGAGALWLVDARGAQLEARACAGKVAPILGERPIPFGAEVQPSEARGACEERLLSAAPAPPKRPARRPHSDHHILDPLPDEGPASLGAILRHGDAVLGVVALAAARDGWFGPGDQARFTSLVPTAGLAVASVQRRTQLARSARETSLLYEMTHLAQSVTAVGELYEALLERVVRAVPCENCTLFTYDAAEKRLVARATRGREVNLIDHIPFEHGSGVSGWVAQQRKQLSIPDLSKEPGLLNVELIPPRVRSFVSVPMVVREQVIGVLNVSDARAGAFSHDDVRVLSLLAGQAALTIERTGGLLALEEMAITDPLTRVRTNGYFQMRLEGEIKRAVRYQIPLTLALIDVDGFGALNDACGPAIGDAVLVELAALVRDNARETDVVARCGGDRFAIIFTQTPIGVARAAADRLREVVSRHAFAAEQGGVPRLTVSVGLADFASEARTREQMLLQARHALQQARQSGRNRVCAAGE